MTLKNKARKHWPKVVVILFSTIEIIMSIQHVRRRKAFLEAMDVSVNLTAAKPDEYAYLQSMADEQHRRVIMSLLKPVLYAKGFWILSRLQRVIASVQRSRIWMVQVAYFLFCLEFTVRFLFVAAGWVQPFLNGPPSPSSEQEEMPTMTTTMITRGNTTLSPKGSFEWTMKTTMKPRRDTTYGDLKATFWVLATIFVGWSLKRILNEIKTEKRQRQLEEQQQLPFGEPVASSEYAMAKLEAERQRELRRVRSWPRMLLGTASVVGLFGILPTLVSMPKALIPWQFLVQNIVFSLSVCTSLVAIYSKSLPRSRLAVRMMILDIIVNISSNLHFYWFRGEEFNPELYPDLTFISLQEYAFDLVPQLGLTWCAYLIVKDLEARDVRVAAAATDIVYEISTGKDIEKEKNAMLEP